MLRPPLSTLFPYTTLFRSVVRDRGAVDAAAEHIDLAADLGERDLGARRDHRRLLAPGAFRGAGRRGLAVHDQIGRATSELQSPDHLVCRLLLEKKNTF